MRYSFIDISVRIKHLASQIGWFETIKWCMKRMVKGRISVGLIDVCKHYEFVLDRPISTSNTTPGIVDALWFLPDFNIGSGGHLNIFRIIGNLEKLGYKSMIVIVRPSNHTNPEATRIDIIDHFYPLEASVNLGVADLPSCRFAIATGWDTAYDVKNFQGAKSRVYFVQDYEPWFYSVGSEYLFAENTYKFGFYGITAGDWLARKLNSKFGMRTRSVGFGVEHERYVRRSRRPSQGRRVFFYARPPTPRRAFELGLLVLALVAKKLNDVEFILAGWDTATYVIPFPHLSCGTVPLDELPDLYSQCDVALVLSLSNLSLLPLELMSCGCVVVSNRGPNVEWLLNDRVCILAEAEPESLASAICNILMDEERLQELSEYSEAYARQFHWCSVAKEFAFALEEAEVTPIME